MTAIAVLSLLAWLYLALLHGRFWQAGPVLGPDRPASFPAVAIVVPARDEAAFVARSLGSLLAQDYGGPTELVLVDDGSGDDTGDIARGLYHDGRLRVLAGAARPPGWAGKLWAVQQGVAATTAPWLLLTDADIEHDPPHLASLMAQAERSGADLVSEMVALHRSSPAETLLIPAFMYFFQMLAPFRWVATSVRRRRTAAAAGGTVLIRRAALERIGGIAAIRGALIDDMALARAVKPGGPIWLGHSAFARSIRPYPKAADIWRMIARSAYVQLRHSPLLLVGTLVGMWLLFVAPVLAAVSGEYPAWIAGLATWLLLATTFAPTLRRFGVTPLLGLLLPAIALFYMAATLGSALDHHLGRGVTWKRRAYKDAVARDEAA